MTLEKCIIPGEITYSSIKHYTRSPDLMFTDIPSICVEATVLDRFLNGLPVTTIELHKMQDNPVISAKTAWSLARLVSAQD